jgi:hypothetical protein
MEIEVDLEEEGRVIDVSDDVDIISNDSNKCQCIPLSIVDPPKTPNPIRKRPKTSNKFGRGERRGGNLKSTGAVGMILSAPESEATDNDDPEAVAEDNNGVASNRPVIINETKLTKAQIVSRLHKSQKKHQRDEDKIDAVTKKLTTAINECKTLAALAQEGRRESNLTFQWLIALFLIWVMR